MNSGSTLLLTKALKRSLHDADIAPPDVQWRAISQDDTSGDDENRALFLELLSRYKDNPRIREVVLPKLEPLNGDTPDEESHAIPRGLNIQPLLILLLKHELEAEKNKTLFETFKSVALQQDLRSKDRELDSLREAKEREIASMREHVEKVLGSVGDVGKVVQDTEKLKQLLFETERRANLAEAKLGNVTSSLSAAHQARVHEVREKSLQLINDEYLRLIHHIRGELRNNPINKERLIEGINEHVDNIRLAVGQTLI
jgi:hypothetical protein